MKNLIIFFPFSKEDVKAFSDLQKSKMSQSREAAILNSIQMTEHVLIDMKFEEATDKLVASYLTSEMWESLEKSPLNNSWKVSESLKMECSMYRNCRGWLIDTKELCFHRLNRHSLSIFKGKVNVIKTFDDIEKFIEDNKHRFVSKKFGI
jgi:hypothetical protein